jgi:hypothetical protein
MVSEMVNRVAETLQQIDFTVGTPNYFQAARAVIDVIDRTMVSQAEQCSLCRFAIARDEDLDMFKCRRHAPRPHPKRESEHIETEWEWPLVLDDEWCGEFEAK